MIKYKYRLPTKLQLYKFLGAPAYRKPGERAVVHPELDEGHSLFTCLSGQAKAQTKAQS